MTALSPRRILAATVLTAGLVTFGAGVATAATPTDAPLGIGVHQVSNDGAAARENPGTVDFLVIAEQGPVGGDDLTRKGTGSPIGDAGQLKVLRP
ncbi:hypothetical protein AB4Z55_26235 [Gordonia sp. ABKF26]|jgi:hypothetical protein|uniref:hypothetical protein n=1 Tax=Gordonia sp. ABKF26 TaxID=3238687 RepID=UPI0034E46DA4